MDNRNLDKALEIISKLLMSEEIGRTGENVALYEEYNNNMEVYDIVGTFLKKMNLKIYEYNYTLFVCAGENNKVFGYTNEELKRAIGLRLNKELYLCYYIIYHIVAALMGDGSGIRLTEYVKAEEIIRLIDATIPAIINKEYGIVLDECEENSFKTVALMWDELPAVVGEAGADRASKASKTGYVKLVFNFLVSQGLFVANEDRYYPKDRFLAIAKNYYDEYRGRLYRIMSAKEEKADAAD